MNQTIRNSGGKSAAHSRSSRAFRRSLTPTLALLAALTLGLVVPVAAEAQYSSIGIIGYGGGGGGGGAGAPAGAGGQGGGGAGLGAKGSDGSNSAGGAGGQGGGGGSAGEPTTGLTGGDGGRGASVSRHENSNEIYTGVLISGGDSGQNGVDGTGSPSGSGGRGGAGGNATFSGAADVVTTITGDLLAFGGTANGGGGGAAIIRHEGTMLFDGSQAHDLFFSTLSGGSVSVYINNLQIDNSAATIYTATLSGKDVRWNTLSLSNGAAFNASLGTKYVLPTDLYNSGFTFNNLYVIGYNNQFNLDSTATQAYTPGALHVNGKLSFLMDNNTISGSAPMLTAGNIGTGSSINLTGFDLNNVAIVGEQHYYNYLREGQSIVLIRNVDSDPSLTSPHRTTVYKGGLRFEDFYLRTTATNGGDLLATYGGRAHSVRTGEAFTPYFQGHMAALYAVSGGSRPALEQATKVLANTPTSVGEPLISLTALGSDVTLNTGSSVDVESFGGVLAVGTKLNNSAGLTTAAVFGEFGSGSYDTYKNIPDLYAFNYGRFDGGGDVDYFGGGVYLHHLFDPTHFAGGFSVEGSFRVGTVKNKFNLDMLDRSGYDISRRYWGGHVGLGYNYLLTNMDSVDMFGQLHFADVENGTFNTTAQERIHFLSAKSTISRLGGRYNHNFNDQFKGYATAAWEYEFEGDVGGSVDRTRIQKAPNIEGSSGFGQLGLNVKSATNPVSLDLSVFGVTGQQEGYGGTIGLKLDF